MNAIREPPEPMGEDLECSETEYWHLLTVPLPDLVPLPLLSPCPPLADAFFCPSFSNHYFSLLAELTVPWPDMGHPPALVQQVVSFMRSLPSICSEPKLLIYDDSATERLLHSSRRAGLQCSISFVRRPPSPQEASWTVLYIVYIL